MRRKIPAFPKRFIPNMNDEHLLKGSYKGNEFEHYDAQFTINTDNLLLRAH